MITLSPPTIKITASVNRSKWNETHRGLTWRDMPSRSAATPRADGSQSDASEVAKKLHFALYRANALTIQESKNMEARRASLGL